MNPNSPRTDMKRKPKYDEYGELITKNPARTVFNAVMASVSALIFAVIFIRLWMNRPSDISERTVLTRDTARAVSALRLGAALPDSPKPSPASPADRLVTTRWEPTVTMDAQGRIQVTGITEIPAARQIQLTVRLNTKYYPSDSLSFALMISPVSGEPYYVTPCGALSDERSGVAFLRLVFSVPEPDSRASVRLVAAPTDDIQYKKTFLNIKIASPDVYCFTKTAPIPEI